MILRTLICAFLLSLSSLSWAQSQQVGDLTVYHNTFNSSYLQPEIARSAGLVRGRTHGVVNIAVQRNGEPVDARISGTVTNLIQQITPLNFIRIQEGDAVYFVANYTAAQRGLLRFEVQVQADDNSPVHSVRFQQDFHPDD